MPDRATADLALLAEALDGEGGLLGNFPHTFSHVGLVQAAWAIEQAVQRSSACAPS